MEVAESVNALCHSSGRAPDWDCPSATLGGIPQAPQERIFDCPSKLTSLGACLHNLLHVCVCVCVCVCVRIQG
jgi:hypothetical protein